MDLLELIGWKRKGKWNKKEILIDLVVVTLLIVLVVEMATLNRNSIGSLILSS